MGIMKDYISLICTIDDAVLGEVLFVYTIDKVYVETVLGASTDNEGMDTSNNTFAIIPFNAKTVDEYISPKKWERLSKSAKENKYTFRVGDIILVNDIPVNCKSVDEIKQKYDNVYTIQAIKTFDKINPHFELTCR